MLTRLHCDPEPGDEGRIFNHGNGAHIQPHDRHRRSRLRRCTPPDATLHTPYCQTDSDRNEECFRICARRRDEHDGIRRPYVTMTHSKPTGHATRRRDRHSDTQAATYVLTIQVPGQAIRTVTLDGDKTYTLGRDGASDIVLDDSCVSNRHAIITASEPPTIIDIGSRNATYLDGQRLPTKQACPVRIGGVLKVGGTSLTLTRGEWRSSGVRRVVTSVADGSGAKVPAEHLVRPVVRDQGMLELYAFARQIAPSLARVLITGETGVGKELMAQAIHISSPRASRQLVVLNCAAIPEGLVESELFGYERGAFSGAVGAKPGLFETAHESTFFLDEVGELPLPVQAKFLRVLETGEVSRLGAVRPTRVDARIVAATNRHLPAEVARGTFRADLYYRLNGLTISIPPLRERPEDIEELAKYFAATVRTGLKFSEDALAALRAYAWPGNVRELKSVVERVALVNQGGEVQSTDLMLEQTPSALLASAAEQSGGNSAEGDSEVDARTDTYERFLPEELPTAVVRAELERRELRRTKEALERTAGNQTEAARLLGISRRTLMNRMDRFGISRPRKGAGRADDD